MPYDECLLHPRLCYDVCNHILGYLGDEWERGKTLPIDAYSNAAGIFTVYTEFFFGVILEMPPNVVGNAGTLKTIPDLLPQRWATIAIQNQSTSCPVINQSPSANIAQFIERTKTLYTQILPSLILHDPTPRYIPMPTYSEGRYFVADNNVYMRVTLDQLFEFVTGMIMLFKTLYDCVSSGDHGSMLRTDILDSFESFLLSKKNGPREATTSPWSGVLTENTFGAVCFEALRVMRVRQMIRRYAHLLMSYLIHLRRNESVYRYIGIP